MALDKNLEIREQWEIEPTEDSLHMGEGGILYRNTQESTLYRCDLNTGESLHFKTTWSFSYQPDFVSPDREPDFWVGVPKA